MGTVKQYDEEFKKQAILLSKEIGNAAAAKELGIPKGTLGTWIHKAKAYLGIKSVKKNDDRWYDAV